MDKLNIRTYTWLANGLSWAYVVERIMNAFEEMGHNTMIMSTNGINEKSFGKDKMIQSAIDLQNFGPGKQAVDLDLCYTIPQNFPQRFLPNSKNKCAIYNFETTYWVPQWKKFYGMVDYYFPSSNFSAEVFCLNGIPPEKVFVIPHGVDTRMFNSDVPAVKLKTKKKFKFVSVVAPHFRKNIDILLDSYCRAFTKDDDVCLVLKTKVVKHSDGKYDPQQNPKGRRAFEIVLGDVFRDLYKKYGRENIPEIEILNGHVENVASIYNACDFHVTATGSEGFGMPMLEVMACGIPNIAPRYSGHLDFLNDDNALLADVKIRKAKRVEQYWTYDPRSTISEPDPDHLAELMRKAYEEKDALMDKFRPEINKAADKLSWEYAAQLILDAVDGKMPHYIPGTYNINKEHTIKPSRLRVY